MVSGCDVPLEQAAREKAEADERQAFIKLARDHPVKSEAEIVATMNQPGRSSDQCRP
jgi:hypothetical protein